MLAGHIRAPLAFADSSTKEALVQSLLSAAVLKSLELAGPPGRQLVDIHKAGLPVLPSGRQAKPDLVLCEGQPATAAVSVLWEAKPDLSSARHAHALAYQLVQRACQLQPQQPLRRMWLIGGIGKASVEL